jgi:chromosome partitioning protein
MKVWAIANQKGGVGKTTTTLTLASILANRGGRVLVIDLDPHGSLTSYLGADPNNSATGIYNAFTDSNHNPFDHIIRTAISGLALYKSSLMLATIDRTIGGSDGKGLVLKKIIETTSSKYDYVLIDCPPILGVLMINALAACDFLIVPTQSEFLSLNGLDRMVETVGMINKSVANDIQYLIVPTMYDRRTRISDTSHNIMKERYGDRLWRYVIPVDTKLREASKEGKSIIDLAPKARGALAYTQLLNDILARNNRVVTVEDVREAV